MPQAMDSILAALDLGVRHKRLQEQDERQEEDHKLRVQILKNAMDKDKIERQLDARKIAQHQKDLLTGLPAEQLQPTNPAPPPTAEMPQAVPQGAPPQVQDILKDRVMQIQGQRMPTAPPASVTFGPVGDQPAVTQRIQSKEELKAEQGMAQRLADMRSLAFKGAEARQAEVIKAEFRPPDPLQPVSPYGMVNREGEFKVDAQPTQETKPTSQKEYELSQKDPGYDAFLTRDANRKKPNDRAPALAIIHTVDANGNPVTRIVKKEAGAEFSAAPTADMRNKEAARGRVQERIAKVKAIGDRLIAKTGPAQRALALKRGAAAVFGKDADFRVYQDARKALAGDLAVSQQGGRPSDADVLRVWLPMIPDVFSDTKESAAMKWDLIGSGGSRGGGGGAGGAGTDKPMTADEYLEYLKSKGR